MVLRSSCQNTLRDAKPSKTQICSSHGGKIITEVRTLTLLLEFTVYLGTYFAVIMNQKIL